MLILLFIAYVVAFVAVLLAADAHLRLDEFEASNKVQKR